MIYVANFWDQEIVGESLESLHKMVCNEQGTETPEYTVKTYESKKDFLLRDVPQEFHDFILLQSWDLGHASGQDEVDSYTENFSLDIRKACNAYKTRLWLEFIRKERE